MDQTRDGSPSLLRAVTSHWLTRTASLAAAAVTFLTGCSGSSSHAQKSASATVRAPSTTSSASASTDTGAALRQWGSAVARLEAPVVKARADLDTQCPAGTDVSSTLQCDLLLIDFKVQAFDYSFQTAERDLGQPPPELATLVSDTAKDAAAVHAVYAPVAKSCGPQLSQACEVARSKYLGMVDQLGSDFDAWKPYTS